MDTFGAKLNTLLKDAATRFKGFEYSSKTLKEEVEKYERRRKFWLKVVRLPC
uniref:Purine rich element binding protein A n=1 Tax=Triticum urartu TaxID=4572 RepID=A0A8R7VFQ0_TRIUA